MTMAKAIPFLDIWMDAGVCTHFHGGGSSGKSTARAHSDKVDLRFRKCASECALASLRLSHFLRKTGVHFSGKCSRASQMVVSVN
jgi:hypothetical protein